MRLIELTPARWIQYCEKHYPLGEDIFKRRTQRRWFRKANEELIYSAKSFLSEKKITRRDELRKKDDGLYQALRRRNLLDKAGLQYVRRERRDWAGMGEGELVAHAKGFIAERKITGMEQLKKADSGLYEALRKRDLLGEVGLPNSIKKYRDWARLDRDELVSFAKGVIAEREITGRAELLKADGGLYDALRRGNLLDKIGLQYVRRERRDWAGMGEGELVAHAKGFIAERNITRKIHLYNADMGLYEALGRRKLLGLVFSEIESNGHCEAVDGVIGALESFGDES